jgi:hypothetical protein
MGGLLMPYCSFTGPVIRSDRWVLPSSRDDLAWLMCMYFLPAFLV